MGKYASVEGIKDLKKHLKKVEKNLGEDKLKRIVQALGSEGLAVAQAGFSKAKYSGTNDVQMSLRWDGNTLLLEASGSAVLFIEFGSGVKWPADNPKAAENGFTPRSWSLAHANMLAKKDFWYYKGDRGNSDSVAPTGRNTTDVWRTYGNPSANVMYNTGKELREKTETIVKQIWGV